jgi:hypothetical protein
MTGGSSSGTGGHVAVARRSVLLAAVIVAAAALCLAAAGCGPAAAGGGSDQRRTLTLARSEFSEAASALMARDRAGFLRWLPVDGGSSSAPAVRQRLEEVFDTLSPLPWRTFAFTVTPARGAGVFRVEGSGQLGAAGPPDRLAVVRYLKLEPAADGAVVLADVTPENLRRRYLMALHDPVVLQRPGLIVLADRRARDRGDEVLAAALRARPRLAALGIATRPTVLITVFGSAEDIRDALGFSASTSRLVFFSYPSLRVADTEWPILDVAVMGPWLDGLGSSMDDVLAHELAHAYTLRWFAGDKRPPSLLVEGIAQAAEGLPDLSLLRQEVATGDQLWPLPESFASADVWEGADSEGVSLGYEIGGSLVDYVVARWGAGRLRPFVQAVAAAEPTAAGMDGALGGALGVTWRQFFAGWRGYVLSGG